MLYRKPWKSKPRKLRNACIFEIFDILKSNSTLSTLNLFTYFINIFFPITDYAYITDEAPGDAGNGNAAQNCNNRHSLSTFVNVSNAPTPPFSMIVTSNTLQPLSNNEPEPYATTDILRAEKEKLQQNHYAVNIYAFFITFD